MPHAFKDLLIPETPQFILNIAVRYVLHHYSSQDIHHCKILEIKSYEDITSEKVCKLLEKSGLDFFIAVAAALNRIIMELDACE